MDILCKLYTKVLALHDWFLHIPDLDIHSEEWNKCLADLSNIYIGLPTDKQQFPCLTLSQNSLQHEIVLQAVQNIMERNGAGSNVLVFGFTKISQDPSARTWQNIESRFPNSSVKLLQTNPWKLLLALIGDKMMLYMLENLSLFLEVKPRCFVQLTGFPVHEMWSFEKGEVLSLDKRPSQKGKTNKNVKTTKKTNESDNKQRQYMPHSCVTFKRMKKMENLSGLGYDALLERSKEFAIMKEIYRQPESVKNLVCSTRKRTLEEIAYPPAKRGKFAHSAKVDSVITEEKDTVSMNHICTSLECDEYPYPRNNCNAGISVQNVRHTEFKAYDPSVILPRKMLLYNINVRERIPISATIKKLEQSGVLALYMSIFKETDHVKVNNTYVTLNPPSLTEVKDILDEKLPRNKWRSVAVTAPDQTVSVGSDWKVIPLLEEFLHNLRSCPYKVLVNHYCPIHLSQIDRKPRPQGFYRRTGPTLSTQRLLNAYSHKGQVFQFVRACLLHILPDRLIGGRRNRNVLFKKLSLLMSLGKYDKFSLGQVMSGMQTRNVEWLQDISSNSCRLYLLSRLVHWIFVKVIWVVLRTMFYITDTTFLSYKLLYYRQTVWTRIKMNGMKDLLKQNILHPMPCKTRLETLIQKEATLGLSTLRFLPKQNSLRPIINMGVTLPDFSSKKISINKQLTDLHLVLSYFKNRNRSSLGYGKLGTSEVYLPWQQFTKRWRDLGQPKLYFVKTDITRCYDSIIQRKLYEIMEKIFNEEMDEEDYISMRYITVFPHGEIVRRQFDRKVFPLDEFDPDIKIQSKKLLKSSSTDTILIDKMNHPFLTRSELLDVLYSHIHMNIIKVGSKFYQLVNGISQGSVISTLLCSFYYAEMERKYFNVAETEFLTRIVDDYLFITPDLENAQRFLHQMIAGIPEYNCFTNTEKVMINFHSDVSTLSQLHGDWFPWCGMMFNTRTLEVSMDYQRYMGTCVSDTMTFDLTSCPGKAMKEKLLYTARQKCRKMYVDRVINSEEQIIRNLFYLFMLTTLKFHAFVKRLPMKYSSGVNPSLLKGIMKSLNRCIQKELKSYQNDGIDPFGVQMNFVVSWLCHHAFIVKFRQHKAQYNVLLKLVQKIQSKLEKHMEREMVQQLFSVCGEDIPEVFRNILN